MFFFRSPFFFSPLILNKGLYSQDENEWNDEGGGHDKETESGMDFHGDWEQGVVDH